MKKYTFFSLSIFSIILLFFLGCQNENNNKYVDLNNHKPEYRLKMLYVLIHDEQQIADSTVDRVKRRMTCFDDYISRESLGKIQIVTTPVYIGIDEFGDDSLYYKKRRWFQWVEDIQKNIGDKYEYDILVFTPSKDIPWSSDAHSIGFVTGEKMCVSMEYVPYSRRGFFVSSYLLTHKMLHCFGYHHQDEEYHQLYLLDWNLGLPNIWGIDQIKIEQHTQIMYFNHHILEVLGLTKTPRIASQSLDMNGLVSVEDTNRPGYAQVSWDASGMDCDKDNIIDSEDDYFLSSPHKGNDVDGDGIIDTLDLCPGNKITIEGNVHAGKINIVANDISSNITFKSNNLNITKIKVLNFTPVYPTEKPEGFGFCFPEEGAITVNGNNILITDTITVKQLKVFYTINNNEFYRSYFYYPKSNRVLNIVNDREWYYFNRFGCDVPADIDLYEVQQYDQNGDGFVDENCKYSFGKIPFNYDWDDDGFPDMKDALPTVHGKFSNSYVSGVKDSDGDGLADPGQFNFLKIPIPKKYFFGEILKTVGNNPDYDWSPFFPGTAENKGCPDLDHDEAEWYFDLHPFAVDDPLPTSKKRMKSEL